MEWKEGLGWRSFHLGMVGQAIGSKNLDEIRNIFKSNMANTHVVIGHHFLFIFSSCEKTNFCFLERFL